MKNLFLLILVVATTVVLSACSSGTTSSSTSTSTTAASNPAPSANSTTTSTSSTYTMAQVAQHNSESDCWLVISDSVYDVTKFIPQHPGGAEILRGCGKDATSLFEGEGKHAGPEAQSLLPRFKIGTVAQ